MSQKGLKIFLYIKKTLACARVTRKGYKDPRLLPKEDNSTMATSCQVSYSGDDEKSREGDRRNY
jgi:hypothetical protein